MLAEKPFHWLEQRLFHSAVEQILHIAACNCPDGGHRRFWVVNFYKTFHSRKDLAFVAEYSTLEEPIFVDIFFTPKGVRLLTNAVEGDDVHTFESTIAEVKPPLNYVTLFDLEV